VVNIQVEVFLKMEAAWTSETLASYHKLHDVTIQKTSTWVMLHTFCKCSQRCKRSSYI